MKKLFVLTIAIIAFAFMAEAQEIKKASEVAKKKPNQQVGYKVAKVEKVVKPDVVLENKQTHSVEKINKTPVEKTKEPATIKQIEGKTYERKEIDASKVKQITPSRAE